MPPNAADASAAGRAIFRASVQRRSTRGYRVTTMTRTSLPRTVVGDT
jgi:hypothetical protein